MTDLPQLFIINTACSNPYCLLVPGDGQIAEGVREAWTVRLLEVLLSRDTSPPLRTAASSTLAGEPIRVGALTVLLLRS